MTHKNIDNNTDFVSVEPTKSFFDLQSKEVKKRSCKNNYPKSTFEFVCYFKDERKFTYRGDKKSSKSPQLFSDNDFLGQFKWLLSKLELYQQNINKGFILNNKKS